MPQQNTVPDPAGEAFWRFSLALYGRPGCAGALLALQDRAGCEVNLILFGLWLGAVGGMRLDPAALAAASPPIATAVVEPLRRLRRSLRGGHDRDILALRRRILGLEIAAERRVQSRLAAAVPARPPEPDRLAAAEANLALCLGDEARSGEADLLRRTLRSLVRRPGREAGRGAEGRPAPPD
jgi:uncharacterized protein (TIGR02444 family)